MKIRKSLAQRIIIRPSELQALYGISRSTAYRLMNLGQFPPLMHLSPRCRGWYKSILDDHFNSISSTGYIPMAATA